MCLFTIGFSIKSRNQVLKEKEKYNNRIKNKKEQNYGYFDKKKAQSKKIYI